MFSRCISVCVRQRGRTCVRAFKERPRRRGETPRRQRRGALTVRTCAPRAARVRVCLKRNIFLYYYSHRAYFSYPPTCIPGGWVCSFSLSVFFRLSFRNASLSLSLSLASSPLSSSEQRERFNPERALFPFYARIATRNCVARPAARERAEETERIY